MSPIAFSVVVSLECKRKGIFDTGFVDPNRVNEPMLENHLEDTERNLLMFLVKQEHKSKILFPYNFG